MVHVFFVVTLLTFIWAPDGQVVANEQVMPSVKKCHELLAEFNKAEDLTNRLGPFGLKETYYGECLVRSNLHADGAI